MTDALDLRQLASDLEAAGAPWEMDPSTSMAQMTEDERRAMLGFTPPPGAMTLEDAVVQDRAAPAVTRSMIAAESGLTAPAKFDHRNVNGKNFTTPPKNQGGCGSCVAHGVAAVMETTYQRATNQAGLNLDLSEAHLFYFPQSGLKPPTLVGKTFKRAPKALMNH